METLQVSYRVEIPRKVLEGRFQVSLPVLRTELEEIDTSSHLAVSVWAVVVAVVTKHGVLTESRVEQRKWVATRAQRYCREKHRYCKGRVDNERHG